MKNQLSTIVKESGLEKTKAQVLLDNFSHYFQLAADWEIKAKAIVITDASQTAEMQMARTGRLFLREQRIAIENTRKSLKEQALREGKAIDGIANVLKALIVPIEEYLDKQEKFIEIKAAEEAECKRIEAENKAEQERIAKEKAEEAERKRIKKENERLKKEAEELEREMKIQEEKAREEKVAATQKLAAEIAKAEKERTEAEAKRFAYEEEAQKEKEATDCKEREKQEKLQRIIEQQEVKAEKAQKEKEEAEQRAEAEREKAKAEKIAYEANMIECPFCHKSFNLGLQ